MAQFVQVELMYRPSLGGCLVLLYLGSPNATSDISRQLYDVLLSRS